VKIFFINCDGGGFADHLEIPPGTTVAELFAKQVEGGDPRGYLIRVNRQAAPREQTLQEGDRVTFTTQKIHGA
jgi:sulfur carrier protein ThiS